jgi:hypothetical protein
MSKKQFNKVIKFEGRNYRYNDAEAVLEWVRLEEYTWDKKGNIKGKVKLDKPQVVDSIGLSRENAEADLMGYIEGWHFELTESFNFM